MAKRYFIVLLLFLFMFDVHGQNLIWNKSGSISMLMDEKWAVNSTKDNLGVIMKLKGVNQDIGGTLQVTTAPAKGKDLNQLWNEYVVQDFPTSFHKYQQIEEGTTTIDSISSKWILFYSVNHEITFKNRSTCLVKDDTLYIITCVSPAGFYELVEEAFEKMINSIRIK